MRAGSTGPAVALFLLGAFHPALLAMGAATPEADTAAPEQQAEADKVPEVKTKVDVTAKTPPKKTEVGPDVRLLPANSGILDRSTIDRQTYREPAEVVRAAPGVDFVYYGQGGVPSGPAIRGYTDRNFGQDIAGFLDGIPLNLFGFVASHGALDLTPLLVDAVERVELVRGPLDARYGDFNRGASLNFVTREGVSRPAVSVGGGSFGERRAAASFGNYAAGRASVYATVEAYAIDGYARNQKLEHVKAYGKAVIPVGDGDISVAFQGFWGDWDAPSYLDIDLLRSGAISDKDAVNPTDGGKQNNKLLYARYRLGATDPLVVTVYGGNRNWTRYRSDFLISPTQTQVQQIDERNSFGTRIEKSFPFTLFGGPLSLVAGTQIQRDDASTRQANTLNRQVILQTDNVDELMTNLGVYAQTQWAAREWLKLSAGLRYCYVSDRIGDKLRAAGAFVPDYSASKLSPKVGVAVAPVKDVELYANFATGTRSPTPRTEVRNSVSSIDRVDIAEPRSYEVGVSVRPFLGLELRADVWRADNSNEIRGIPPGGTQFESLGESRREGIDAEVTWYPAATTRVYAALSFVDPRLLTPAAANATHLPDVPRYVHQFGVETQLPAFGLPGSFSLGADVALYGERDLNTTSTLQSEPYERVTAKASFSGDAGYRAFLGMNWYPGSRFGESEFLFGSKIGVRPMPRVAFQGGVSYTF